MTNLFRNAVMSKEMRTRMRGWRSIACLLLYAAILAVATVVFLLRQTPSFNQTPAAGSRLLQILMLLQLLLILIFTPASLAPAISGERQRGTWDLLLMTRLSSFAIVWGKLIGGLVFNVLLLVASLPLIAVVFLFDGATPGDVTRAYLVLSATVLLLSSLSLCVSALTRRPASSAVVSTVFALLLGLGLSILIFRFDVPGTGVFQLHVSQQLAPLAQLDPVAALASALPDGNGETLLGADPLVQYLPGSPFGVHLWIAYSALSAVLAALFSMLSIAVVRGAPSWLMDGAV